MDFNVCKDCHEQFVIGCGTILNKICYYYSYNHLCARLHALSTVTFKLML